MRRSGSGISKRGRATACPPPPPSSSTAGRSWAPCPSRTSPRSSTTSWRQPRSGLKRKRSEVRVAVEVVFALRPLEEVHDLVGQGCHHDLPGDLQEIVVHEDAADEPVRPDAEDGQGGEDQRVDRLPHDGGSDGPAPEPPPPVPDLHLCQHIRVAKLPPEVGDERGEP